MPEQREPLRVEAKEVGEGKEKAVFIFMHGYGDDAEGVVNIAHQFQSANKLPHLTWIFPNAPHHHESMSTAWYPPPAFSPIPVGSSSSGSSDPDPEDEPADEAEVEILVSVEYICSLINAEIKNGVKLERIVLGGFSQGCAISLTLGLGSRYAGQLGGIVALSGYLPHGGKLSESYKGYDKVKGEKMDIFLAHGTKDMLVPMRVYRDTKKRVEAIVGEERVKGGTYEGMGHVFSGAELRDVCGFLEWIVGV